MFSPRSSFLLFVVLFAAGCASQHCSKQASVPLKIVRTTAYTQTEAGGGRNAIGGCLCSGQINSAAADWSRFPLGTKFQILNTGEVFKVDDYGSALIGTNTIDLYKTSRFGMRNWGVRYVNIRILEWGSSKKSLDVLEPRGRNRGVRVMIDSLRQQS